MPRAADAARNNALWCHAVCRAHGAVGEFQDAAWLNRQACPPFYPNLVTLKGAPQGVTPQDFVQGLVHELAAGPLPSAWTVKDSFSALDLSKQGFDLLFEATWIWREPTAPPPEGPASGLTWSLVRSADDLVAWNRAWASANGQDQATADLAPQFPPSLLAEPGVVFLAGHQGTTLVAGAILNHTDAVVGVSNLFALHGHAEAAVWPDVVHQAGLAFHGLPLVGYERGASLDAACAAGLAPVGPLRVWLRRPA